MISIIVGTDGERGIGKNGGIPWHVPEDLKEFKRLTMGGTIVVGSKTWSSIPGTLPGREVIVVTRDPNYQCPKGSDIEVSNNLEDTLRSLKESGINTWIIGGGEIYKQALDSGLVDRVIHGWIHSRSFGCDTFFPRLDSGWCMMTTLSVPKDGGFIRYNTYLRSNELE